MSQLIQQQEQLKTSQIIRTYCKQFKQIPDELSDGKNGRCVMGALMSYCGWDGTHDGNTRNVYFEKAIRLTGSFESLHMVMMNNTGKTFDEIADWLEIAESIDQSITD